MAKTISDIFEIKTIADNCIVTKHGIIYMVYALHHIYNPESLRNLYATGPQDLEVIIKSHLDTALLAEYESYLVTKNIKKPWLNSLLVYISHFRKVASLYYVYKVYICFAVTPQSTEHSFSAICERLGLQGMFLLHDSLCCFLEQCVYE